MMTLNLQLTINSDNKMDFSNDHDKRMEES